VLSAELLPVDIASLAVLERDDSEILYCIISLCFTYMFYMMAREYFWDLVCRFKLIMKGAVAHTESLLRI
jgi:hypothetical protein